MSPSSDMVQNDTQDIFANDDLAKVVVVALA
jgi:hypothetical protein